MKFLTENRDPVHVYTYLKYLFQVCGRWVATQSLKDSLACES